MASGNLRWLVPVQVFWFAALAGCSNGDGAPHGDQTPPLEPYLGLTTPDPGDGFQIRNLGMPIPAGEDLEFCEVAEFPGDADRVYWVSSLELGNGDSSHHLIISAAIDGSPAAEELSKREIGERVPCLNAVSAFGDGFESLGLSQKPYRVYQYPPGVGRKFRGKQRFVFDYHYFNTTDGPIDARSAVNFHLTTEADVKHVARPLQFSNVTIDTPPGQSASFLGECRASADLKLFELTRHTHRWGKDFEVWFAGGARDGEQVFLSPGYDEAVDHEFAPPIDVAAGEGFRIRCDYENTTTHPLRYGPNATDEMCSLHGLWWSDAEGAPSVQFCAMTRIGADGVARAGNDGEFPKPTPEDVSACLEAASSTDVTRTSECTQCSCEHCAVVLERCARDIDCLSILDCVNKTGCTGNDCSTECKDAINAHSPGAGPLIQVAGCVSALCPVCSK